MIFKLFNWVRLPGNRQRAFRLGRESVLVVGGHILAVLGGFVGVRVLTELLSRGMYGRLALLMSVIGAVMQLWGNPLAAMSGRYYVVSAEEGSVQEFGRAVNYYLIWTAGALLCLATGGWLIFQNGGIVWPVAVIALSVCAVNVFSSVQHAARQRAVVAIHQGLAEWFRFAAAAWFVWLFGASLFSAAWGYAVGLGLVAVSQRVFFRRLIYYKDNPFAGGVKQGTRRRMWTFGSPLVISGIFLWVLNFADRWALQIFASAEEVGLYFATYQLGFMPMALGAYILSAIASPFLFTRAGSSGDQNRMAFVLRINGWLALLVLFGTIICFLCGLFLHEWVFRFAVAPDYAEGSILWPWLIFAGGFYGTAQTLLLSPKSTFQSGRILWLNVVAAVVGVFFYFAGAWGGGVLGLVAGLCIYSVIYCIMATALHMSLLKQYAGDIDDTGVAS